jgi:Zn-dependent protease
VHEASHALVSFRLGDDTAYRGGQVSLDPIPHIRREPFGMVLIPILTYILGGWMMGWASAPYDPVWARRYPQRSVLMSLAGPFSNLLLALIAAVLIRVGIHSGFFLAPDFVGYMTIVCPAHEGSGAVWATLVSLMFSMNILLFIFNLIPIPPLDGSSIPLLFLSDRAAEKYWEWLSSPAVSMMGIFVAWEVAKIVIPPVFAFATNLLYPGYHYA